MKTILIVDDDELIKNVIEEGLTELEERVKSIKVNNGLEALEAFEQYNIELVITDISMPEMDGFELITHIHNLYSEIPIIVMTAFGSEAVKLKTKKLGALVYLEKPFAINDLLIKVNEVFAIISKGFIQGITLPSFLQLLSLEKKTCILIIKCNHNSGRLYLDQGKIVEAETEDLVGLEAAYEIISWNNITIEIDNLSRKVKDNINVPTNYLIMESMRIKDEKESKLEKDIKKNQNDLQKNESPSTKKEKSKTKQNKSTKQKEILMSVQEKLKGFADIEGFGGVGLFTPTGENLVMLKSPSFKSEFKDVGVLANNVLMNAQKTALEMGVGRGQLVHVEAESAHFIVRCLNEGTDPLKSQPGKAHIHLVLVLTDDSAIGLAKMKVNNIVKSLADDFRD